MDEPKNILNALEDDLAAAEQEPKLFLGRFQNFVFKNLHFKNEELNLKRLKALTLGVACLCCLTLLILLGCHRFKKKDEGSYAVYQQGKKHIA